jgi:Cft2 family RNA processing exonuclease
MDQTDAKPRLFQGFKALHLKNRASLSGRTDSIDAVILTHAHLDHCGYLPLLIKRGSRGAVYRSRAGSLSRAGLHLGIVLAG